MFEYYAWANLKTRIYEPDELSDEYLTKELMKKVSKVKDYINKIDYEGRILKFGVVNANFFLFATGFLNHRTQEVEEIFELFRLIKEIAPGSYGLIYTRYHDDPEKYNEFRVWRLARGKLDEMNDPFLSPCIPTIEDDKI